MNLPAKWKVWIFFKWILQSSPFWSIFFRSKALFFKALKGQPIFVADLIQPVLFFFSIQNLVPKKTPVSKSLDFKKSKCIDPKEIEDGKHNNLGLLYIITKHFPKKRHDLEAILHHCSHITYGKYQYCIGIKSPIIFGGIVWPQKLRWNGIELSMSHLIPLTW